MTGWWEEALGRTTSLVRVFTTDDVAAYAALTGDSGADHEVPEPLITGLFSTLLGVHLPGHGTNYLKQACAFVSPATVGEEVRASVEVSSVRPEKQLVDLTTICVAGERVICRGQALVLARGVPSLNTSDAT